MGLDPLWKIDGIAATITRFKNWAHVASVFTYPPEKGGFFMPKFRWGPREPKWVRGVESGEKGSKVGSYQII